MKNQSNSLLSKLESNVTKAEVVAKANSSLTNIKTVFQDIEKDTEEDYDYIREKIKGLIEVAEDSIERLNVLAQDSEHPRAFEVLSTMIHQTAVMIERLLDIQNKRKKLHLNDAKIKEVNPGELDGKGGHTFIFNGTTSELQKMIKNATPQE